MIDPTRLVSFAIASAFDCGVWIASALAALLHAARTACAFVSDTVYIAIERIAHLVYSTSSDAPRAIIPLTQAAPSTSAAVATALPSNPDDERPITSRFAPHNMAANAVPIDPNMPDIVEPNVIRAFDALLVPPPPIRLPARMYAEYASGFATSIGFQAILARDRIQEAYREQQRDAQGHQELPAYTTYACGCDWCPNHTAAYPLCAAVTIRRRMRVCGGNRAAQSPASNISRRQNMCGYRDPAVVFAGRLRR